jgi:hypothetical protein
MGSDSSGLGDRVGRIKFPAMSLLVVKGDGVTGVAVGLGLIEYGGGV